MSAQAALGTERRCVYLLHVARRNVVKIGNTDSARLGIRTKEIAAACGHPVTLLGSVPGDFSVEAAFHEAFAHLRVAEGWDGIAGREWFHYAPPLRNFVEVLQGARSIADAGAPPHLRLRWWRLFHGLTLQRAAALLHGDAASFGSVEASSRVPLPRAAITIERITGGAIRADEWGLPVGVDEYSLARVDAADAMMLRAGAA